MYLKMGACKVAEIMLKKSDNKFHWKFLRWITVFPAAEPIGLRLY